MVPEGGLSDWEGDILIWDGDSSISWGEVPVPEADPSRWEGDPSVSARRGDQSVSEASYSYWKHDTLASEGMAPSGWERSLRAGLVQTLQGPEVPHDASGGRWE